MTARPLLAVLLVLLASPDRGLAQRAPGPGDGSAVLVSETLIAQRPPPIGTGTLFPEPFHYQLPSGYDAGDPGGHPLVIAYHGFSGSSASVHIQSTIDEQCDARNWIYVAPTGLDSEIFGTPMSQQHTEAVALWMIDRFNVDVDRIYMVGFSMGARVTANFAARHRAPEGLMIAAIGLVAASYDNTQAYMTGSTGLKQVMEHPLNFGTSPDVLPFAYRSSSALHFAAGSYPPLPGTVVPGQSMAANLHDTPVYTVWEVFDASTNVVPQAGAFKSFLLSIGGTIDDNSTLSPNGAGHSWAILNEVDLFNFLSTKSVQRFPSQFNALLDESGDVSFADVVQRTAGAFTALEAEADPAQSALTLRGVINAERVSLHAAEAQMGAGNPLRITAISADEHGFTLRLTGFDQTPSYLLDAITGELITGVASDPVSGALIVDLAGHETLQAFAVSEPWTTALVTTPNPVRFNQPLRIHIDAAADEGTTHGLLVIAGGELISSLANGAFTLTAALTPDPILIDVVLDAEGHATLENSGARDPALSGLRIPMQFVGFDPGGAITTVSNLWQLDVQ